MAHGVRRRDLAGLPGRGDRIRAAFERHAGRRAQESARTYGFHSFRPARRARAAGGAQGVRGRGYRFQGDQRWNVALHPGSATAPLVRADRSSGATAPTARERACNESGGATGRRAAQTRTDPWWSHRRREEARDPRLDQRRTGLVVRRGVVAAGGGRGRRWEFAGPTSIVSHRHRGARGVADVGSGRADRSAR